MNPSEPELVAAAQKGDETAFATLAERYSSRIHRILVRITADDDTAQDALQDALLRAWKSIDRFEGRSGFSTWLTRIAINEAYRTRQRAEARPAIPLDDAIGERIPTWGNQPDEIFETREFLSALDAALVRLPEEYRAAVVLRDVEGFDTIEAASVLEIGEAALKSRLHRGRMALRREMDTYFNAL